MVASTDIKFYVHTNNNAPQLQNAYGSMINVLNACLVNGINIGAVSSLTASGKIITALFSSTHNLMQYQVIKITGAAQTEFNGDHPILTVPNSNTVTFELGVEPSVTAATGTISASLPPLGWEKPFSSSDPNGGGKAAYRSTNLLLPSRPFLRVVDELDSAYTATYAKYAKVGIVEDMTDIDTMLGVQAPRDSLNPNKNWVGSGSGTGAYNGWAKWYYARSGLITQNTGDTVAAPGGARGWVIVGNGDYFYVLNALNTTDASKQVCGFGAFKSLLSADNSANFLAASINYHTASATYLKSAFTGLGGNAVDQNIALQRNHNQLNPVFAKNYSFSVGQATQFSGVADYIGASTLNRFSIYTPVLINESVLRGEHYGIFWLHQFKPYTDMQLIEHDGRLLIAVDVMTSNTSSTTGQILIQVGGDL